MNNMAKGQLQAVAATHMNPERMMRLMANAIRTTPKLADCDPLTLLGAMMTSASLGLEPNTPLGHAYLIPFQNRSKGVVEVQFIIGYKGMISLARRSGAVVNIHADVVYEGDEFSYEYGSEQHLRHKPSGPRKSPTHAYCHAKLVDGEAFIVLPWEVVIETRDASQGWKTAKRYGKTDTTPWGAHLHAMAKKTAVRRLFDELPISIEEANSNLSDGISVDEQSGNFAAFALDPTSGVPVGADGPVIEHEGEDEPDATTDKGEGKEDPAPTKENAPTEGEEEEPESTPDFAQFEGLRLLILKDLEDAQTPDDVDEILALYESNIAQIKAATPEVHKDLMATVDEMREALGATDGQG
jgi:recombination protein RecT